MRRDVRPLEGRQRKHEADLRAEVRRRGVQKADHAGELVASFVTSSLVEDGVEYVVGVAADTGLEPGDELPG